MLFLLQTWPDLFHPSLLEKGIAIPRLYLYHWHREACLQSATSDSLIPTVSLPASICLPHVAREISEGHRDLFVPI